MPAPSFVLIDQLRRMVAEPAQDTYTDDLLSALLLRYPLPDASGYAPTDTAWAGAWDANRAAGDVWEEKAAALAGDFDFSADGGRYSRSQAHAQALQMARMYRGRRSTGALVLQAQPRPESAPGLMAWLGNAAEDDD